MRWTALGVDYEMCGKDLIDSVTLSSKICRALGATPPENFIYELFLDEAGDKISKSKGNGLTVDEWLTYASPESLSLFMYQKPKAAKKLFFDVIPKTVDEYLAFLAKYPAEEPKAKLENPVWHIHAGAPPHAELPISFALLLNLVSVSNAEDTAMLWGFIRKYAADATPEAHPLLDHLVGYALAYYDDFVKPAKTYRAPTEHEAQGAGGRWRRSSARPRRVRAGEELQNIVYAVGKAHGFEPLRAWFAALYEVLLGQIPGSALRRLHRALRRGEHQAPDRAGARRRTRSARRKLMQLTRSAEQDRFGWNHFVSPTWRPKRESCSTS